MEPEKLSLFCSFHVFITDIVIAFGDPSKSRGRRHLRTETNNHHGDQLAMEVRSKRNSSTWIAEGYLEGDLRTSSYQAHVYHIPFSVESELTLVDPAHEMRFVKDTKHDA